MHKTQEASVCGHEWRIAVYITYITVPRPRREKVISGLLVIARSPSARDVTILCSLFILPRNNSAWKCPWLCILFQEFVPLSLFSTKLNPSSSFLSNCQRLDWLNGPTLGRPSQDVLEEVAKSPERLAANGDCRTFCPSFFS